VGSLRVLAIVVAFGAGLAVFAATRAGAPAAPSVPAPRLRPEPLAELQAAVRARRPGSETMLASAYLQRARETGDLAYHARAEALLQRALARDPRDAGAVVELGTLAASRHDFRRALGLARRARSLAPGSLAHFPLLVDALVELGRYGAAERTLQRFADQRPGLPAYARISYLRELHGDLAGAARAMALAVAAGGAAAENVAAVQVVHGDLEAARGHSARAARDYAEALAGVPGFVPALAGRARLAAASGDLRGAIATLRRVVARLPLPEHVIALGELQLAAGRPAAARRTLALVDAQRRLLAGAGVDTDAEIAVFEADHGLPRRAVALGRRAWAAAPGIRSADALGWALTRAGHRRKGLAWARSALRLGSLDPLLRFHAGMAARGAQRRRHLRLAMAHGLAGRPWQAATARRALAAAAGPAVAAARRGAATRRDGGRRSRGSEARP
jgi:tetratricopeptide (TPR) repeat protein